MPEAGCVLDASPLLCLLFGAPGAERVEPLLPGARMSAANLAEVVAKLVEHGADGDAVLADLAELDLAIVPLDRAQAEASGLMRVRTCGAGLSLGDRCCLALAASLGATAITTDRTWAQLDGDAAVLLVR
jgi:PIN domain nuclease of toxin-antitoxin system